jgi:ubiquinone/menaquinone biosynthesis C-methylase UbiE
VPATPSATRMRDTSWAFNIFADVYAWFTNQTVWHSSCSQMAELLPRQPGLLLADLGCGPGASTLALARRRSGARVIGLDVAPRMVRIARRAARTRGLSLERVRFVVGDATRLPFHADAMDAVTGHSFLYQVPDRPAALSEIVRVLRPGGRLILMEPNAGAAGPRQVLRLSRHQRHLIAVALWRPFSRLHGRFTPQSLTTTLMAAGFRDCHVRETLGGLGLLASATRP